MEMPPHLKEIPNKPVHELSIEELKAERDYWKYLLDTAEGWGAAVGFAHSRLKVYDRRIAQLESLAS